MRCLSSLITFMAGGIGRDGPDVTNDVLVPRVAHGLPECSGPWSIDFNEDSHASDSPHDEDPFNRPYKRSSNALPTIMGMDDEAVQVAAPAVEGSKDRAYQRPVDFCDEQSRLRACRIATRPTMFDPSRGGPPIEPHTP